MRESAISSRIGWLAALLLISMVGCGSVRLTDLGGEMGCDGTFLRDIAVDNVSGQQQTVTLSVRIPPRGGVDQGVRIIGDKQTIAAGGEATYQVQGKLSDPCMNGQLTLVASDDTGTNLSSRDINILAFPLKGAALEGVSPGGEGDFRYQASLECCAAGGSFGTGFGDSTQNVDVRSDPAGSITCTPPRGFLFTISGNLEVPTNAGTVEFSAVDLRTNATCDLLTMVEPAQ